MKQKEIQTTVYEASDGKQFLYEGDCKRYEERLLKLAKIQYFKEERNDGIVYLWGYTRTKLRPLRILTTSRNRLI